jgi:hypothetical protein
MVTNDGCVNLGAWGFWLLRFDWSEVPIDQRRLSRPPNFDISNGLHTGVLQNNLDIRRGSAPVSSQTNPTPKSFTTLKVSLFLLSPD